MRSKIVVSGLRGFGESLEIVVLFLVFLVASAEMEVKSGNSRLKLLVRSICIVNFCHNINGGSRVTLGNEVFS